MLASELVRQINHYIEKFGDKEIRIKYRGTDYHETTFYPEIKEIDCGPTNPKPSEPKDIFVVCMKQL